VNISSGNLHLNKKYNDGMLTKQNIIVGHFASLVYGHVMQASDATPHSNNDNSWCHLKNDTIV
jgi:hypothetical protein